MRLQQPANIGEPRLRWPRTDAGDHLVEIAHPSAPALYYDTICSTIPSASRRVRRAGRSRFPVSPATILGDLRAARARLGRRQRATLPPSGQSHERDAGSGWCSNASRALSRGGRRFRAWRGRLDAEALKRCARESRGAAWPPLALPGPGRCLGDTGAGGGLAQRPPARPGTAATADRRGPRATRLAAGQRRRAQRTEPRRARERPGSYTRRSGPSGWSRT